MSVSLEIIPSPVVPATTASVAAVSSGLGCAINKLLGREHVKGVSSDTVGTLNRFGGGESPARTALSLVLDGSQA